MGVESFQFNKTNKPMNRNSLQTLNLVPIAASIFVTLLTPRANAGHEMRPERRERSKETLEVRNLFDRGTAELQIQAGAYFSMTDDRSGNQLDFAIGSLRTGWMISSPHGAGLLRGNTELLLEVFGGGIFDGPGDGLAGASLLLRYNFVQPDAKWVPYFQIGGGGVWSDAADDDKQQRLIGSDVSFNLQAAIGLRCFLSERWALTGEVGYLHISNADTASRNIGVNAVGGQIGVSYFFF